MCSVAAQAVYYPVDAAFEKIRKVYPHWHIAGIEQVSYNGWQWEAAVKQRGEWKPNQTRPLHSMRHLAAAGVTKISLLLLHANGVGEARPDYWLEEFAQPFRWQPNDHLTVNVNQGNRDAYVLAVIGDEALIEYEMPAGTTALWVIDATSIEPNKYRNVSYRACPKRWKEAMDEACTIWESNGQ